MSCVRADPRVLIEQMNKLHGVKEVADHTLEDLESEVKFGQLSGDDYVDVRLRVYLDRFEEEADGLDRVLLFYKVSTYVMGAVSGFLSYVGFEVSIDCIVDLLFPPQPTSSPTLGSR